MLSRLKSLFKAEEAAARVEAAPPAEQHIARGHLRLVQREAGLCLEADFAGEPLLTLAGRLAGTASTVQSKVGERPATLISFPLDCHGRQERVQVTAAHTATPAPEWELVRATHRRIPEGHAVEVVYAEGEAQARYLVELPLAVEVVGFKEFSQSRPVFDEVPPVAQMVAFLKATIHQRRTTLRSLATMARRASHPGVLEMVGAMEERLSQGHDFTNPGVQLARAFLEAHGRSIYPNTVAALCLLSDIYLGNLGPADLEHLVEEGRPMETSAEAARAAVEFLGVRGSSKAWRELRPEGLSAPRWKESRQALDFLQETLGRRTALTILQDLAEDSGSERSRSRVAQLLSRVPPDQVLVNDEHEALQGYLEARGRLVAPETIAAMGIYVDFEVGILSAEDIDSLTPHRGFWDTSLYGMLAIAGAFEQELRPLHLAGRSSKRWGALARLAQLSHGGVIARFLEKGQPGYTTVHLDGPSAVEQVRRQGLRFTGEVLASLPTIDYLNEPDLVELTAAGQEMMACFGAEDKAVQWRRIAGRIPRPEDAEELLKGEFSYIDGYRVYHFFQSVVARLVPAPEELRAVVVVYRDQRGNAHFKYSGSLEDPRHPPQHGWEFAGEAVEFPDLRGLPRALSELGHDYLLGRPEKHTVEQSRLDWILSGVRDLFTDPWPFRPLADYPDQLARLDQTLASTSLGTLLVGVVDDREAAVDTLRQAVGELEVAEPVLEALSSNQAAEFAALALLDAVTEGGEAFTGLLLDRLYALADVEDPALRALACRLLGSRVLAGDEERQLAARYVLNRALEHDRSGVGVAAARTLAALALDAVEPLPPLARREDEAPAPSPAPEAASDAVPSGFAVLSEAELGSLYSRLFDSWEALAELFELDLPALLRQRRRRELLRAFRESLPELRKQGELPFLDPDLFRPEPPDEVPEGSRLLRWLGREAPVEPQDLQLQQADGFVSLLHPEAGPPERRLELEALHAALVAPPRESSEKALDYDTLARELVTFFNLPPDYVEPVRTMLYGVWAQPSGDEELEAEAVAEPALSPLERRLQTTERALFEAEQRLVSLTRQVHDDPVTGLPGALVLELAVRYGPRVSTVLVCRLAGEEAELRDVTQALREEVEGRGLVARTGPDEFALQLEGTPEPRRVGRWATRLREATRLPLAFGAGPDLEQARQALESALEAGVELRFADPGLQRGYEEGSGLEYELWRALDQQEFTLFFQPVVDLDSGRAAGFEALLRWEHSERGLLAPADFLETAERIGLVETLGPWIAGQVAETVQRFPEVWFSCNRAPALSPAVVELLPGDPWPPGSRAALDRAGVAGWPLECFSRAAFVKLDRSLIAALPDSPLAYGAVALARSLRLEPVAVGVETPQQLACLRGMGCSLAQGFLLCEPQPRARLPELLERTFLA